MILGFNQLKSDEVQWGVRGQGGSFFFFCKATPLKFNIFTPESHAGTGR